MQTRTERTITRPSFTYTAEENEKLSTAQADLSKYIETSYIEFISGTRPLSDWDSYVERLKKLGMDEVLGIYNAAISRYNVLKQETAEQ